MELAPVLIPVGLVLGAAILSSLRVLYEYERGVIFRLGKLTRSKGPGLIFLVPFGVERMRKMDLRIVALDITPQDTITKDNVSVKVNAVVYFRVADPSRAVVEIEDYFYATSQLAQTTLRSVIGQSELDELLAERDKINEHVREIIDEGTDPWGIEVTSVEVKDIDLPKEMKRAMAKQAEAERERRGKVIAAEGELQASRQLSEAARIMSENPASLQLRYLQTAVEIAAENNSTTVFPIPMEMFPAFTHATAKAAVSLPAATEDGAPLALPDGADPQALAEAAKTVLGIGSGQGGEREKSRVPAGTDTGSEEPNEE
ncbi:MAG: SPFH domain-containing protein [Gemmatimonadota bacterium]|nr:MAG: SPFH domain-containing protein [Gemmatimonadota bacterium]